MTSEMSHGASFPRYSHNCVSEVPMYRVVNVSREFPRPSEKCCDPVNTASIAFTFSLMESQHRDAHAEARTKEID